MSVYTENSRRRNYGGPGSLWRRPSTASPVSLPEAMLTPKNFGDRINYPNFVGPMHPDKWAMNKGLDNWGAGAANTLGYDGTFRQEGFGDPNAINMWGGYYVPDYNYDTYDDEVLDPGFGDHAIGPLYFG